MVFTVSKMPHKCCVPLCRGNSRKGPHVSVFSFPKDEALAKEWLRIIKKKSSLSKHSRICELHFEEDAIVRETSVVDPSSGRLLFAKLDTPRLKKDAIPTKIPVRSYCLYRHGNHFGGSSEKKDALLTDIPCESSCLSSCKTRRASPSEKRQAMEHKQMSMAITESLKSKEVEDENDFYFCLDEGFEKIQTSLSSKWRVFKNDTNVVIAMLLCNPAPTIICSVILSHDLKLTAFCSSREMKEIENYKLPMLCNSIKIMCDILNSLEKQTCKTAVSKVSDDLNSYFLVVPKYPISECVKEEKMDCL